MEHQSKSETTLRDLLRVVFRHKLIFLLVFIVIVPAVYIGMELRTPRYRSQVVMLVAGTMQKDVELQRSLGPGSIVATQMMLVKSLPIIKRASEALKLYDRPIDYEKRYATKLKSALIEYKVKKQLAAMEGVDDAERKRSLVNSALVDLRDAVSIGGVGGGGQMQTSMFSINVDDFDPRAASIMANVVSRSYVIFDIEQQIAELKLTYGEKNATIIRLRNYINTLEESLDGRQIPDIEAIGPASVKIVGQASYGRILPMKPGKNTALIIAILMSTILSTTLAYVFDYFDQTFKSPQDIETYLNVRYLGSISKRKSKDEILISHSDSMNTDYSKSSQNLSENIYLLLNDKDIKSLLIVDAEGSEETAAVIANIGIYLANKVNSRVLIIDANVRETSVKMSQVLNIDDSTGLTEVFDGQAAFEDAVQILGPNFSVLTSGKTLINPKTLLESDMLSDLIRETKENYDVVLINCADMKNYTDAAVLASLTNGIVLVINEGQIRRQIVENAIAPIKENNVNIVGAVINNRMHVIPEIIYKLT